ncbi:hypothetical protein M5D96_002348, partial [Drosophila gunungcola]
PPLYALDQPNVGRCLDYCHLKNLRFLLCVDADGQLSHNPYKDCNRGFCKAEDFELNYETDKGLEVRSNRVEKTRIFQKVMTTDNETLRVSAEANATNSLLSNFEDYLDALSPKMLLQNISKFNNSFEFNFQSFLDEGVVVLKTNELSVFFVDPDVANRLHSTDNENDISAIDNLETAAFLPETLWRKLTKKGANYLVFKVYTRDALFVETGDEIKRRPTSNVVSITIPGLVDHKLPEKLPFFLRNGNTNQTPSEGGCGYWNYKTWLSDGISTSGSASSEISSNPVILCYADHLTQFTFLLGVSKMQTGLDTYEDDRTLDIITNVGLSLSLLGLFLIFLTAAVFKSFRMLASTKILLNLCSALGLQLLFFLILSQSQLLEQLDQTNLDRCTLIGAVMQYLLLVVFSWMFIIGFLQYQRYVRVIGVNHPRHYILIAATVAWTLPLIPTILVVLLKPDCYRPSNNTLDTPILCYPSGYGLSLGVILPIGLITVANALMVGYITWSVYKTLFTRNLILKQLGLFVLLFFLLGITWIFGLCTYFDFGRIFAYLFCLTATLQGFVLFLYFIVFNKDNQRAWLGLCCNLRKKSEETIEMPTDSILKRSSQSSNHITSN